MAVKNIRSATRPFGPWQLRACSAEQSRTVTEAPTALKRKTGRRVLILGIAIMVVATAGALGGWYLVQGLSHEPGSPSVRDDGPTFYQALGALNATVVNQTGGPWSLFSVMGIAAASSFSPNVVSYNVLNQSAPVNGCQAALNGLTMFNGSIPIFNGTFNSGTAPFWQLAYFSDASQEILVGTDAMGVSHLFPPFSFMSSNCTAAWGGSFARSPNQWTNQIYSNGSLPINSPAAAQVAWTNLGAGFANHWIPDHSPVAEVFALGPAMLDRTQSIPGGNWGIDFLGCGLAGHSGIRNISYAGTTRDGQYTGDFNGTVNCALLNQNPPGIPPSYYSLAFSSGSQTVSPPTEWTTVPYQVDATYSNGSLEWTDVWGLANWMVGINLTSASGQALPLADSGCPDWVSTAALCVANQTGWYVVLLSQGGEWLGSYGMTSDGPGWSVPVTALVSHQQMVIVTPSSWNVTGDVVKVSSTFATVTIGGSVSL